MLPRVMTYRPPVAISVDPRVARAAGIGLTAYGLVGILLIVVTLLVGGSALARVERLSGSLDSTLAAAASTARSSAATLDNLRDGVGRSSTATADAGHLADQASLTSSQLATAMNVRILGSQPLAGMAGSFSDLSTQLDSLSGDLRAIGTALDTSTADLDRLRADVGALASRLEGLAGPSGAAATISGGALRLAFVALLIWLAIPALGALLVGLALLGFIRRPIRPLPPAAPGL